MNNPWNNLFKSITDTFNSFSEIGKKVFENIKLNDIKFRKVPESYL